MPLIANMLLVSINVSLENISLKFPAFINLSCCVIFAPVAQLVEHRAVTREVVSSTPAEPTLRVFK